MDNEPFDFKFLFKNPETAQYIDAVVQGTLVDPVLTVHLKDGWSLVRPIHGYLQHDADSDGWAEIIQWVNPACPPPPEFALKCAKSPRPVGEGEGEGERWSTRSGRGRPIAIDSAGTA